MNKKKRLVLIKHRKKERKRKAELKALRERLKQESSGSQKIPAPETAPS